MQQKPLELHVELGERSYPIVIGRGLLSNPDYFGRPCPRRVITDQNVATHYLQPCLQRLGLTAAQAFVLQAGERQKSWENLERLLDWLLESRFPRDGEIIALGGGVIGDIAGFCASIYQRGVDFVQIPTTLLSQVDSSVGGKTAVNHPRGKNMIGAFHQPKRVIADLETLKTLPARELSAGLAEVIKTGMLADAAFFAQIESQIDAIRALDPEVMAQIIARCCRLKASIVGQDEREAVSGGPRALLNLGHTFGHAVETYTQYESWLHGEAVGLGLCMAADLSARLGNIEPAMAARCEQLVEHAGLPTRAPSGMTPDDFLNLMALDKKVAAGNVRLILLRSLGEAYMTAEFDPAALQQTLKKYCR